MHFPTTSSRPSPIWTDPQFAAVFSFLMCQALRNWTSALKGYTPTYQPEEILVTDFFTPMIGIEADIRATAICWAAGLDDKGKVLRHGPIIGSIPAVDWNSIFGTKRLATSLSREAVALPM